MSVRIQLDDHGGYYTNLDFITGRVILYLTKPETVSSIVVKLEGESRSLLIRNLVHRRVAGGPLERNASSAPALEYHKILYKTRQLFPPDARSGAQPQLYTLPAGQHEYPFRLKIPFNNMCGKNPALGGMNGFGGLRMFNEQIPWEHVIKTLPPSWTGIPNMAEIRYYVKVTVQRPGLFRENRRAAVGFRFLPIEPPRPPPSELQRYARRQHTFQPSYFPTSKGGGLFSKHNVPAEPATPPAFEVNARLPNPPILTCNETIPLRVFVRKQNQSPLNLYLLSLQLELIGYTDVRAEDERFRTSVVYVIMSAANLFKQLGTPADEIGKEITIDSSLWSSKPLPPTIPPSFLTCNITRFYELEVKLGLGFGSSAKDIQPQTVQLPLRFSIDVYSGIAPPPALLNAMNASSELSIMQNQPEPPAQPTRPTGGQGPPDGPPPAFDDIPDEAPPSYEDAMADNFHVPDSSRRVWSGETDPDAPSQIADEKNPFRNM